MSLILTLTSEAGPPADALHNQDSSSFSFSVSASSIIYQTISKVIAGLSSLPLWTLVMIRDTVGYFSSRRLPVSVTRLPPPPAPRQLIRPNTFPRRNEGRRRRRTGDSLGSVDWNGTPPLRIKHRRELASDTISISIQIPDEQEREDEDQFSPADEVLSSPTPNTDLDPSLATSFPFLDSASTKSWSKAPTPTPSPTITPSTAVYEMPIAVLTNPKTPEYDIIFASGRYHPDDTHLEDISETKMYFNACDVYYRRRKESSLVGRVFGTDRFEVTCRV